MNLFARVANEFVTADRYPCRVDSDLDEIFSILSNERRRQTIWLFEENDNEPTDLDTLSRELTEREYGVNYESQQRKRIYIALYQSHLIKLNDAGVIRTEKPFTTIDPGPNLPGYIDILEFVGGCRR